MPVWLKSNREVAECFANQSQDEGKGSNFFFELNKLYSWGYHFCIARFVDPMTAVLTTYRHRSQSTRQHAQYADEELRSARVRVVYAYNPMATARVNKTTAKTEIKEALDEAALPRIRQPRRDAANARALYLAKQFNTYLAALPEVEQDTTPLPETINDLRDSFIVDQVIQRLDKR